jgi:renal tumor antigen
MLSKKGEGTFSEVLKCQNVKDGTYWACKKMKQRFNRFCFTLNFPDLFALFIFNFNLVSLDDIKNIREIQALRQLNGNIHILQLHEVIL